MTTLENEARPNAAAAATDPLLRLDARISNEPRSVARTDALRSLVKFAIGRGYYDRWSEAPDKA